jgi:hypothetical protein
LNKWTRQRSNLVAIFQNARPSVRVIGAILLEQDAGTVADRRYFSAESMGRLTTPGEVTSTQELLMAIA